jgi:hypothetical protein
LAAISTASTVPLADAVVADGAISGMGIDSLEADAVVDAFDSAGVSGWAVDAGAFASPEGDEHAVSSASVSESKSQAMESRAVIRSPRLAWKALIELFQGEDMLRARIEGMRPLLSADDPLIQLIDKYLSGWKPDKFDD